MPHIRRVCAARLFQVSGILAILALSCTAMARSPQDAAGPRDEAFISRADGSEQRYVLIEPPTRAPGQPMDLLIALHGHGSDRWQFIRQERPECSETRRFAAAAGMLLVSPDYRAPPHGSDHSPKPTCCS